jgi:ABC-type polysaccharide/polyol phosphate export permease
VGNLSIQRLEEKVRETSKATGRKTGSLFGVLWNMLMDLIFILAVVVIVSVLIYTAYSQGVNHPILTFFGEKIYAVWSAICAYFGL